jgi:hypothetical protein
MNAATGSLNLNHGKRFNYAACLHKPAWKAWSSMMAWRRSRNFQCQIVASHWVGKNAFGAQRRAGTLKTERFQERYRQSLPG